MQADLDQQVKSTQYCLCSHKTPSYCSHKTVSVQFSTKINYSRCVEGSFLIGSLYFTFMPLAVALENVTDATDRVVW